VFSLLALFGGFGSRWPYLVAMAIFYDSYYLAFILGIVLSDHQLRSGDRDAPLVLTLLAVILGLTFGSYPYYGADQGLWSLLPTVGSAHKAVFYHILGAVLLIQAANQFTRARRLLARPAFRFLGRISYSLYLIHFPLVCSLSTGLALFLLPTLDYSVAIAVSFLVSAPLVVAAAALFTELVDRPAIRIADGLAELVVPRTPLRQPGPYKPATPA